MCLMSEVTCVHNQLGGRLFALASVHTSNSADSASWWRPKRATPPAAWLRGAMLAVIAVTLFTCTHKHVALVSLAMITRPDNHVALVSLGKASAYDHFENTVVEIDVHRDQPLPHNTICSEKSSGCRMGTR